MEDPREAKATSADGSTPAWLQDLRSEGLRQGDCVASCDLIEQGRLPTRRLEVCAVLSDVARKARFDLLAAIFDAKPFALDHLTVNTRWLPPADAARALPLLRVLNDKLLNADDAGPVRLDFNNLEFDEQEADFWVACLLQTRRGLCVGYQSCAFGPHQDRVFEATAQVPKLEGLTLTTPAGVLSAGLCHLLREHECLRVLKLVLRSHQVPGGFAACVRGNRALETLVVQLEDGASHVELLEALRHHPSLRSLELGLITAADVAALENLGSMPALKKLRLHGVEDDCVVPTGAFARLNDLSIATPQVAREREPSRSIMTQLCGNPRLKSLAWRGARLLEADRGRIGQWLAQARKLRSLKLDGLAGDGGQLLLDGLAGNKSLVELELRSCASLELPSFSLGGALQSTGLKVLKAFHPQLGEKACSEFASLIAQHPSLEVLDLSACAFEPGGVDHFCEAIARSPRLVTLVLNNCLGLAQCVDLFMALKHNQGLKHLAFRANQSALHGRITAEQVHACLDDQFSLLEVDDHSANCFEPDALALLETLLERNRLTGEAGQMRRWREALGRLVAQQCGMPDIARALWDGFAARLANEEGRPRDVLRSRAAWQGLQSLTLLGREW